MGRYLRLLGVQFRASATVAMQYRLDFLVEGGLAVFWMAWSLAPLLVVFGHRQEVAGWSFPEALVVIGWFTLMKGVLEGAVNPSLVAVVEHIRKGTLDFVLLKPADSQFLVSTAKFEPWRVLDLLGALAIFAAARWPVSVFRGVWRVIFTAVIPLALMTTWPALALLGRLDLRTAAMAVLGAALFSGLARLVWLRSIARYTSASS